MTFLEVFEYECARYFYSLKIELEFLLQYVQVLVLDWILDVRTSVWEREAASDCDTLTTAPEHMIHSFQTELASLRKLINVVPVIGVGGRVVANEPYF